MQRIAMPISHRFSNLAKVFVTRSTIKHTLFFALVGFTFEVQALTPSQVFDKVKDSVVVVKALDANGKAIGQGSGVLLPSGKIGTNCHVVKNGASFQVGGGKQFVPATVWGSDEDKDICLLEATGLSGEPAKLGQASRLKVGEQVYAVGAPRGLELSLSDGIVSQLRGGYPPFIQTTAAISPGSSGGGLFDAEGQLVGFTTLYVEGAQSLNFAMPVEWAEDIQQRKKALQGRSDTDWVKRAIALQEAQNWTGLLDWCQRWTKAQPGNGSAWFALGSAHFNLNRHSDAIESYQQALRINPEDSRAWASLAAQYNFLLRYTEAAEAAHQAIRIDAEDANAWIFLGFAYSNLKLYTEAIDPLRQAIRIDPANATAWELLGRAYCLLRRFTEAIDPLRQAIRINPANAKDALLFLVISYEGLGDRAAALEAVNQLRRIDPAKADEISNLMTAPPVAVSSSATAGWVVVSSTDTTTYYAEPNTIRKAGDMAKMWVLRDHKMAESIAGMRYMSGKEQSEYDCKEERARILYFSCHSGNMGAGEIVRVISNHGKWMPLAPGSVTEHLWKFACGKQ